MKARNIYIKKIKKIPCKVPEMMNQIDLLLNIYRNCLITNLPRKRWELEKSIFIRIIYLVDVKWFGVVNVIR